MFLKTYNLKDIIIIMGLFGFLKKKKVETEEPRLDVIFEKNLTFWIEEQNENVKKVKDEIFELVHSRILDLDSGLKETVTNMLSEDLKQKPVDDKTRLMVSEARKNYSDYVSKLSKNLLSIDSLDEIVEKINSIVSEFDKRSEASYEKVTIVQGKWAKSIRESLKSFLDSVKEIFEENKGRLDELHDIMKIEKDSSSYEDLVSSISEVSEEVSMRLDKKKTLMSSLSDCERELDEIMDSDDYKAEIKRSKDIEKMKKELDKDLDSLSEKIDFKGLCDFYHSNEKEMNFVKQYRESFRKAFYDLGIGRFSDMLMDSKFVDEKIASLIDKVKKEYEEVSSFKPNDMGISDFEKEIVSIKAEIENIDSEVTVLEKRVSKLEDSKTDAKANLKDTLEKFGLELK